MDKSDIDWNYELKDVPWGNNMFTQAMWNNVQARLRHGKKVGNRASVYLYAGTILLLVSVFISSLFYFADHKKSISASIEIPSGMVRIEAPDYITVMPSTWVQLDVFPDPNQVGFKPSLSSKTEINIGNFSKIVDSRGNTSENILLKNYKESKSQQEFEQRMLSVYKEGGSFDLISSLDGTNIYGVKTANDYAAFSFPVVDNVPFCVILQSQEISDADQFKSSNYFANMISVVKHIFPK